MAMSLAMGFSARTCLPAARAASTKDDCETMGSAMMTAWMSVRWRRSLNVLPGESSEYRSGLGASLTWEAVSWADLRERE